MSYFLDWLEKTSWAVTIRQSMWLYPTLEILHILGIIVLVGAAFMFDLNVLGFSKNSSSSGLARYLLSWSARGLLLVVPSGILLFITNARTLGTDPVFWLKMMLLIIAACNALVFHQFIAFSAGEKSPFASKICACVSIVVWIAVVTCGRLLAY